MTFSQDNTQDSTKPELWIATFNDHKKKEFLELFSKHFDQTSDIQNFEIKTAKDLSYYKPPAETGSTFLENATIKAKSLYSILNTENAWVLAEDSGLCVDGLNGMPGIHSARYAGEKSTDIQNTHKLLNMVRIRTPHNRKAHYHSAIVILGPNGVSLTAEDQMHGELTTSLIGKGGFGYDPIFIPSPTDDKANDKDATQSKTLAELPPFYKKTHSHRSKALRKIIDDLKSLLQGSDKA